MQLLGEHLDERHPPLLGGIPGVAAIVEREVLPVEVDPVDSGLHGVIRDLLGIGVATLLGGEVIGELARGVGADIGDRGVDLDAGRLQRLPHLVEARGRPRRARIAQAFAPGPVLVVVAIVEEAQRGLVALERPPEHRDRPDDPIGPARHRPDVLVGCPPAEPPRHDGVGPVSPRHRVRSGRRSSGNPGCEQARGKEADQGTRSHGSSSLGGPSRVRRVSC